MSKEYIERETLISALESEFEDNENCRLFVSEIPKADVVEVVRCGQCKLWKINPNNLYGGQCRYSECASIDHFCSHGVRKDGASDE